eukprot:scaffold315493_cov32-Tisochrysis_lutea.AAC.1
MLRTASKKSGGKGTPIWRASGEELTLNERRIASGRCARVVSSTQHVGKSEPILYQNAVGIKRRSPGLETTFHRQADAGPTS